MQNTVQQGTGPGPNHILDSGNERARDNDERTLSASGNQLHLQTPHTATHPGSRIDHTDQIRFEQVKIIYRHLPAIIAINAIVGSAMVFGLWNVVSRTALMTWGIAMALLLLGRGLLLWAYSAKPSDPSRKLWPRGFTLGSGLSGILWGAAGVVLYPPGALEFQLFILFVLMGMGAGAITSLTAYMPAFYAFLPISLLPIGARLMFENDSIHLMLGITTTTYAAALSFFARPINKALVESLKLRFENIDLVQELSLQRDEAERANLSKSKFLAAASHDLRQPLHALTLFTTALDERIKYPEVRSIVDKINNSRLALENLINALLDVSRLDAGVLEPRFRHFPLRKLTQRLVKDFSAEAAGKNLKLECTGCDAIVYSDPALLERILSNLLANAVRYTHQGTILIVGTRLDHTLRIDVIDSGIGIPADQYGEIFKEFFQLGNPERDRNKGLGLGLAIVDRVARLLGHRIDVDSTLNKGSRFSVTVPLGDIQLVQAEKATNSHRPLQDLAGEHVLVVDDEIGVREGMLALLTGWGCDVTLAGSEDEAVKALRASGVRPDAIIMDYRLREGRTGTQAIQRLQHEWSCEVPALLVTGDTAAERLREAKASGYELVHKPIQPAMLRAFLRNRRIKRRASSI